MLNFTQQGIDALKGGDKVTARQKLRAAIAMDNRNLQAWLWLSGAVETDPERLECLQQVLRLDPENQVAARGLAQLVARGAVTVQVGPPVSAPPAAPAFNLLPPEMSRPEPPVARREAPREPAPQSASPSAVRRPAAPQPEAEKEVFKVKPSLLPTALAVILVLGLTIFSGLILAEINESLGLLTTIFMLFMVFIRASAALLRRLFTVYTLTNRHLIVETGLLSRGRKTIPIQKIQDVAFHQPFVERLFGMGDVIVESAGEKGAIHLIDLSDCQARTEQILKLIQKV